MLSSSQNFPAAEEALARCALGLIAVNSGDWPAAGQQYGYLLPPRSIMGTWSGGPTMEQLAQMASLSEVFIVQASYSPAEFRRIGGGLASRAKEDKWAIFLEEDVLHLHRSWTGLAVRSMGSLPRGKGGRLRPKRSEKLPSE